MTFEIVCDSACDVPKLLIEKYKIGVVKNNVSFGSETYKDGEISYSDFLKRLLNGEFAKTSQPAPADYQIVYDEVAKKGRPILSIHITSKLSGTFSNANLVARDYDDIKTFDTLSVSIGAGYLIQLAVFLREKGLTREEVVDILYKARDQIDLIVIIEDIRYIKNGGRISFSQFALLKMLKLRPLIDVVDGILVSSGIGFSHKGALKKATKRVNKNFKENDDMLYIMGYSSNAKDVDEMKRQIPLINDENSQIEHISVALLAHTGPDAAGILIAPKFEYYFD